MKIGIFGGTFNPPHIGHLIVAETVRDEINLDKIFFVPSFISPHKQDEQNELAEHRYTMTRLAIEGNKNFECLDVELKRKDVSFTIDTVTYIHKNLPKDVLYLIIGMDNYQTFHNWKNYTEILDIATLVVMNRPHYTPEINPNLPSKQIYFASVPNIGISSSEIRERIMRGESVAYQVSEKVLNYIELNGLYK